MSGEDLAYYNYYFATEQNDTAGKLIAAKNRKILNLIQPHLKGKSVLELGVGRGYFAAEAISRGFAYIGIEASGGQCDCLREHGVNVLNGLVPPIIGDTGVYELVYNAHLIEHLAGSGTVFELFSEANRVLTEDGVLAVMFPDFLNLKGEFYNCDYTHVYPTTERRISQIMKDTGFEPVSIKHFNGNFYGSIRHFFGAATALIPYRVLQFFAGWLIGRENIYRGWMYFKRDILIIAKKTES